MGLILLYDVAVSNNEPYMDKTNKPKVMPNVGCASLRMAQGNSQQQAMPFVFSLINEHHQLATIDINALESIAVFEKGVTLVVKSKTNAK